MKKILIVDDDEAILEVLTLLLTDDGYQVVTIKSGDTLQKQLDVHQPNLVIMDIWMPGLHGHILTNWLKSEEKYHHIPVILMSASNDAHKLALQTRAEACVEKPFDINELTSLVARFLLPN